MTIYPGVRVVMECSPGGPPPATGANPWKAEIDFGHVLHATGTGGAGTHTRSVITAATYSALQTAVATTLTSAGIT
jgi:hypothetical protein